MLKRLLTTSVMILMCVVSFAQNWDRPLAKDLKFASELKSTLQKGTYWDGDTTIYYLYNVEADAFLTNNTCPNHDQWSTHAALKKEVGNPIFMAQFREDPYFTYDTTYVDETKTEILKIDTILNVIPWDNVTYKLLDLYNGSWRGVFPNTCYTMFVDRGSQPNYMWNVKDMGNGIFRISVSDRNPDYNSTLADSLFGNPETYLGFNFKDEDYYEGEDVPVMPLTPMISVTGYVWNSAYVGEELLECEPAIDWKFIPQAEFLTWQSQVKAWDYINSGALEDYMDEMKSQYGNRVNLSAAEAILNSTSPVLYEDIEKMQLDVQLSLLDGASDENPVDATVLMQNANFDALNVNGWTLNYTKGTNVTNLGIDPNGTVYTNGDIRVEHFIEAWSNVAYNPDVTTRALGDGSVYQTIAGLPAGKYTFTCDAISVCQDNKSLQVTGAYLYAKSGDNLFQTPICTGDGIPEHFEVMFIKADEGGTFEFGFRTEKTTANWMACDNFELTYYGPVKEDPYKIVLDGILASIESDIPDMDDVYASIEAKETFAAAMEAAAAATDDFKNQCDILNAAYDAFKANIKEYQAFKAAIDAAEERRLEFDEVWPDLSNELADLLMEWEDLYAEGTADDETCQNAANVVQETIMNYITENMQPGDNITPLINNGDFKTDFSGWKTTGAVPAWGGISPNNLNPEEMTSGNAEVFQAVFNMYQVIRNMPKGSFTLTCQAFERNDQGYAAQFAQGPEVGINGVLYANSTEKKINNILAYAQPEQIFNDGQWWSDVSTDYGYIPNGMPGANYYFNISPETYQVKLTFTLPEAGDSITIGLKTASTSSWIIFDNFELFYNGNGVEAYEEPINDLLAELEMVLADATYYGTDAADLVDAATKDLVAALNGTDGDACIAALEKGNKALAYAKASVEAYNKLNTAYDDLIFAFEDGAEEASPVAVEKAEAKLAEIEDAFDNLGLTVEEVDALTASVADVITGLRIPDYTGASEDNPIDFTGILVNPNFTESDGKGWTWDHAADFTPAFYNSADAEGAPAAEYYSNWSGTASVFTWDTYQTLSGLPNGVYTVTMNAFYRPGDNGQYDGTEVIPVEFYANQVNVPVRHIASDLAETDDIAITLADGTTGMVPNGLTTAGNAFQAGRYFTSLAVKVEDGNLRIGVRKTEETNLLRAWMAISGFTLTYYGEDADMAVVGIDEVKSTETTVKKGIFTISGQKVNKITKGGLYIVDGKKVFVK